MYKKGFTLIELLVVISIIGLLSSVVLASLNTARAKARDARRAQDMVQIMNALNLFYDKYGYLPVTNGSVYTPAYVVVPEAATYGWDYSSQGAFMGFLETSGFMSKVPVDPINSMTGDNNGGYAYRYYCYKASDWPANPGLHLGYWSEATGQEIMKNNLVGSIIADSTYDCK